MIDDYKTFKHLNSTSQKYLNASAENAVVVNKLIVFNTNRIDLLCSLPYDLLYGFNFVGSVAENG